MSTLEIIREDRGAEAVSRVVRRGDGLFFVGETGNDHYWTWVESLSAPFHLQGTALSLFLLTENLLFVNPHGFLDAREDRWLDVKAFVIM